MLFRLHTFFIGCVMFFSWTGVYAQMPKYSNEFLSVGVGARAFGMAGAQVALADDVTAGYWNPAGLSHVKVDRQVGGMHAEYFAGIAKYEYAALAAKTDEKGALGFSFIRFGVDDIPNTSELIDQEGNIHYDRVTSFSAADYGFVFSFGKKSKLEGLSQGVSAKVIHRKAGDFARAWGFGIDAGLQYEKNLWRFGLLARDITSTFNMWSYSLSDQMKEVFTLTGNQIPESTLEITLPALIAGLARRFEIKDQLAVVVVTDVDIKFDGERNVLVSKGALSADPHIGVELDYKKIVFLRTGVGNIQEETDDLMVRHKTFQLNLGVGVNIKDWMQIDYALTDLGDQSIALYSNIVSVRFSFDKKSK